MSLSILVSHQKFFPKWKGRWVYVGRDFSKINYLEKVLDPEKRISLAKSFRSEFDNERINFLTWIEKQRKKNNDSLFWWMSHLAGRNNMCSFIFESICQIKALNNKINNNKYNNDTILVVCENIFLCDAICANMNSKFKIKKHYSVLFGSLFDKLGAFLIIPVRILKEFYRMTLFQFYAKLTFKKTSKFESNIFLLNLCLDNFSFQSNKKLNDRYLTILPEWLERKNFTVYRLPWLYNVKSSYLNIFKRLRKDNCLIIEDHLSLSDYFLAIRNFIKSIYAPNYSINYTQFNIKPLLFNEQLIQARTSSNIRFWLNGLGVKKWASHFNHVSFVDTFELMTPEHATIHYLRNSTCTTNATIGYYHSLVSKDFLAYWSLKSEWKSKVFPDHIITNGKKGKETLIKQGYDSKKIIDGPALRIKKNLNKISKKREGLLLLCPYETNTACEAIYKLSSALNKLNKHNINVQVKSHPMMMKSDILKKLPNNSLPNNWTWNDSEISDVLNSVYCCVVLASASVFDAILSNCVVINLQREFSGMGNFSDLFEQKYPVLKEIEDSNLPNKIEDVFFNNKNYYVKEFQKIRLELIKAHNPINDLTMKCFLKDFPSEII